MARFSKGLRMKMLGRRKHVYRGKRSLYDMVAQKRVKYGGGVRGNYKGYATGGPYGYPGDHVPYHRPTVKDDVKVEPGIVRNIVRELQKSKAGNSTLNYLSDKFSTFGNVGQFFAPYFLPENAADAADFVDQLPAMFDRFGRLLPNVAGSRSAWDL